MTGFFALLRLQLLSRYAGLKPRNLKARLAEKKGRFIGRGLLYFILIAYLGGMLFFLETKMLDIMLQLHAPEMLVTMAVVLATLGTLVMAFFFVLSTLYLGRDAAYLAALPLRSRTVLSAKLVQVWISETLVDAVLLLPACILYGVRTGAAFGFYLRMIVVWLLIAWLPVCVIAFLSSLLIRISALWKHREVLLTVGGIVLMVGYMYLMMNIGGMTGGSMEDTEMLQQFVTDAGARIDGMTRLFPPAAWAEKGMLGQDTGRFLLWIALSLAAPVLTVWLLGYGYRGLSMLQSQTPAGKKKKLTGRESFSGGSPLRACVTREIRSMIRVPSYATNILPITFMPLLMVVFMGIAFGRASGEGAGIGELVSGLPAAAVMSVLAAVMAYMGGMNPALSTAVTREGKGHDYLTSLPVPYMTLIRAKFIVGFTLSAVGMLAASAALAAFVPGQLPAIALAFVLCMLFSFACDCYALARDIRKPKLDWVTEQEAVKQNFGMLFSMLVSWGALIALGVLTFFLIRWGWGLLPVFGLLAVLLALLCAAGWIYMKKSAEKYYCAG